MKTYDCLLLFLAFQVHLRRSHRSRMAYRETVLATRHPRTDRVAKHLVVNLCSASCGRNAHIVRSSS